MFNYVQGILGRVGTLGPKVNPIGIDLGTESLRLAQVGMAGGGEWRVTAAACTDVPGHLRRDPAGRAAWLPGALRELLAVGRFRGRSAALCLPAGIMSTLHLRLPKLEEADLRKALPIEVRGKLPVYAGPRGSLLRHLIAGEIFVEQESRLETIVMSAPRDAIDQMLAAASKAKLDVVTMNVEPVALVDCFARINTRKGESQTTVMYVDIGASGTRAVIAQGGRVMFVRAINVGGEAFDRAVSTALKITAEEARIVRIRLADAVAEPIPTSRAPEAAPVDEPVAPETEGLALLGAGLAKATRAPVDAAPVDTAVDAATLERRRVETACREPLERLASELDLCRRYHEATFPAAPVDRLVFVGGESRHRPMCQAMARRLNLPAHIGDPIARLGRSLELRPEMGVDRAVPNPGWAVAVGLSLGPASGAQHSAEAA